MSQWRGPKYEGEFPSLGWAMVEWIESLGLEVPAGPKIGEPLRLTNSQIEFFVRWYRLDPVTGQRIYRRGQNVGPKGCGKSPEGALLCLNEFDGPSVFGGWDEDGEPIGLVRPDAVVGIVGLSESQTGNMYDWLYSLLINSDAAAQNGWNVELGRITKKRGGYGVLEALTSSQSSTGKPLTFVAKEETWLWTRSSGMLTIARSLDSNTSKTGGSSCEFTNPPELGVGSLAEKTQKDAQNPHGRPILINARRAKIPKILNEGGLKLPENEARVRRAIRSAYGDSMLSKGGWMSEDDVYFGILDEQLEPDAYRLWLGVERVVQEALINPELWDRAACPDWIPIETDTPVVLSFDGSVTRDSTVIMATTLEEVPRQEIVAIWERPLTADDWRVSTVEVDDEMMEAFDTYDVRLLVADKEAGWESQITAWEARFGEATISGIERFTPALVLPVAFNNQYRLVDSMVRLWISALEADTPGLAHAGSDPLNRHIASMRRGARRGMIRPIKAEGRGQLRQIDAGICSIMGYWGAVKMRGRSGGAVKSGGNSRARSAFSRLEGIL